MHVTVNGARLFIDIDGSGSVPSGTSMVERPTLFVLHGGPGSDHSYFKPWLGPLTDLAQLVYVDHRGNGRSERTGPATYNVAQMADDLEALRQLLGFGKIQILGHSFGGMVALTYAIRHPEALQALIPCTTAPSYGFRSDAWKVAERTATPEQMAVLSTLFDGQIRTDEEHEEWWRICLPLYFHHADDTICAEILGREHAQLEVVNYMMESEIPKFDVLAGLPSITAPTLAIAGRYDWVTPVSQAEAIVGGIPGAGIKVFENSGHFPFIEDHDEFLDVVGRFVSEAAQAALGAAA